MLDHPMISQINRTGYSKEKLIGLENAMKQPECCGTDFYCTEVLAGDEVVIDTEHNDEQILKEHLKRYLIEEYSFIFRGGLVLDRNLLSAFDERFLEKHMHEKYHFQFKIAE